MTEYAQARSMVLSWLSDVAYPQTDQIRGRAEAVVQMMLAHKPDVEIDLDQLVREIEANCNVFVPDPEWLEDRTGHIEWLPEKRAAIEWRFWKRYERLLEEQGFARDALRKLDEATEEVLRRLEDPTREGSWDRRGMVVGQVQSGKTAHYIGLMCKAVDAGYRLIVVLAGMNNNLRSQTQLRLDHGFLGWDTARRRDFDRANTRIGVGALHGFPFYYAQTLTTSLETGDFRQQVARNAGIVPGGDDPVVLVVKKNKSVLENLIEWATFVQQELHEGRELVRNVPLLVIDDEADHASVNTRDAPLLASGDFDPDYDPTRINALIRTLLHRFDQSVYVGYTATPFANIFIQPDATRPTYGEDLFPRSFIVALPPPSNHFGPARVFGLVEDETVGVEEQEALPVIREVLDSDPWVPDRHKSDVVVGPLPPSVREAMRAFILACSARAARGQRNEHNSMLVHVTRYVAVQQQVADQIAEELRFLQNRLAYGDGAAPSQLRDELRVLWERDFERTTVEFDDPSFQPLSWDDIEDHLHPQVAKIQVLRINGTARDALEYYEHRHTGLSVIAIGGDKLSRGLTLEGLTVSYYLRASDMYDTLMQMGRWFGYRPGYEDLCRLYTTPVLVRNYRTITAANEELLREFRQMAAVGATPANYGLRVRSSPDGLLVTARVKMRTGVEMKLSYSHSISETIFFHQPQFERNLDAATQLATNLSREEPPEVVTGNSVWKGVGAGHVLDFLRRYSTYDQEAQKARSDLLGRYIESRLADAELTNWTVAVISNTGARGEDVIQLGPVTVGLTKRENQEHDNPQLYVIKRLVSPTDESLDLTEAERARALRLTQQWWQANPGRSRRTTPPTQPSGLAIRHTRPEERGLLLLYALKPSDDERFSVPPIGFAISFPRSENARPIDYVVNNTYLQQELGLE